MLTIRQPDEGGSMFETDAEIAQLQAMFDAHLASANPHVTGIVNPERRLTARQV